MRYYFPLFVFLFTILFLAGAYDYRVLVDQKNQALEAAALDLSYTQQKASTDMLMMAARKFYANDIPARAFLAQWRPKTEEVLTIPTISGWISDRAAALDILMDPGAGQLNPEYTFGTEKIPVFSYPVTLTSNDWVKIMDFLADFEAHFPVARMDSITISSDASVVLIIGPVFPQFSFSEPIVQKSYEELFALQQSKASNPGVPGK